MTKQESLLMLGKYPHPIVTVDVVLLTLKDEELCAALVRRVQEPAKGEWTLPGGWVHTDKDEDALAAAMRILRVKAGVEAPYLEQLQSFAGRHRDARGWSVSIAHYALVPYETVGPAHTRSARATPSSTDADSPASLIKWRPVDAIRSLPFDHLSILRAAVDRVRSKTLYSSLPVNLLGPSFTLGALQRVYELVLGSPLDKRGFRRRIEELDIVEPIHGDRQGGAAHRPAQRYRVKRKFNRLLVTADKNIGLKTE